MVEAVLNAVCDVADAASSSTIFYSSRHDPFILSGGDDGMLKVWDLRQFQNGVPVATFKHHNAPITSVEWHPTDSTVFAASGDDNQITLWDLAVEKDEENEESTQTSDIPPQLLFIHMVKHASVNNQLSIIWDD